MGFEIVKESIRLELLCRALRILYDRSSMVGVKK
jgi:hypothetical protein